jgi:hypothetical protein
MSQQKKEHEKECPRYGALMSEGNKEEENSEELKNDTSQRMHYNFHWIEKSYRDISHYKSLLFDLEENPQSHPEVKYPLCFPPYLKAEIAELEFEKRKAEESRRELLHSENDVVKRAAEKVDKEYNKMSDNKRRTRYVLGIGP